MKTGTRLTYIFLDRGTEDMQLLAELHKITVASGIKEGKEFHKTYPCISELKQKLEGERESCS